MLHTQALSPAVDSEHRPLPGGSWSSPLKRSGRSQKVSLLSIPTGATAQPDLWWWFLKGEGEAHEEPFSLQLLAKQVEIRKSVVNFCFIFNVKETVLNLSFLFLFFHSFHACLFTGVSWAISGVLCEYKYIAAVILTNWTGKPLIQNNNIWAFSSGFFFNLRSKIQC